MDLPQHVDRAPLKELAQTTGAANASSSSSSYPSSMETCTLGMDLVDGFGSEGDEGAPEVWGRLFPIGRSFTALGMERPLTF